MTKKAIVVCYYGKFPQWIDLWLKSCEYNKDFDFIIVTDIKKTNLPKNVTILSESFIDLKERFSKVLGFECSLDSPYKLCDYKPLYGIAFRKELEKYDFWGHCDMDMVFGRINNFFTEDLFENYDRIGTFGHLIFYRNISKINELYKLKGTPFSYKTIYTSSNNYGFDEKFGYNLLCKKYNIKWFDCGHTMCLDKCYDPPLRFFECHNNVKQCVFWKRGNIYLVYKGVDGKVSMNEYMYFHFSKTKYEIPNDLESLAFGASKCYFATEENLNTYLEDTTIKVPQKNSSLKRFLKRTYRQKYIYLKQRLFHNFISLIYK